MLIYRLALLLMFPVWLVFFVIRLVRTRETREGLAQRLGRTAREPAAKQVIWVHGASIGELTAARSFILSLLERSPNLHLIITMNSYSSRDMVRLWNIPQISAALAPLDYGLSVKRFLAGWQPILLISLENEMWPNRMHICQQKGIPVIILGGRLSEKAARLWGRFPSLTHHAFGAIDALAPQDESSAMRFADLGVPSQKIGKVLNLKSSVVLGAGDTNAYARISKRFDYSKTIIAASTHDQEDQVLLDALVLARKVRPDLRMIIVPRHPERAADIQSLVRARGLESARWSTDETLGDIDVLIADTLGEMALWYAAGHVTVIGGTFAEKGGHTPFEPAQFSSAIVHGPSTYNHASAFAALHSGDGALMADNAKSLSAAILQLGDEAFRQKMIKNASRALAALTDNAEALSWLYAEIAKHTKNAAFDPKTPPNHS